MKMLSLFAAFLLATSALQADTYVLESFDEESGSNLDNGAVNAAGNEVIRTLFDTGTSRGTSFAWGGYTPSVAQGNTGTSNTKGAIYPLNTTDRLVFAGHAICEQGRAYTRFDTVTTSGNFKTSSVTVTASGPEAGVKLSGMVNVPTSFAVEASILIHHSVSPTSDPVTEPLHGWFRSEGKPLANGAVVYQFSSLKLKKCDYSLPGVLDMEDVDNAGEADIDLGAIATDLSPADKAVILGSIDGMGIVLSTPAKGTGLTGQMQIADMLLSSDVIAPAAPAAASATVADGKISLAWDAASGAAGYNVYRGTVAGGPYTKVNTTAVVTGTSYQDLTATNGTQYYYVVRSVDAAVPTGNESANSLEVPAKISLLSAARNWAAFE